MDTDKIVNLRVVIDLHVLWNMLLAQKLEPMKVNSCIPNQEMKHSSLNIVCDDSKYRAI